MPPAAITAGISASLTGQFATQGTQALAGLTAWAEYVNAAGGLTIAGRHHPLALRHYDDASRADHARRNTARLLDTDRVHLLFGPYSARLTAAAAEIVAARQRLLWNHGGAGDAVYSQYPRHIIGILTPARRYLVALPTVARIAYPNARTLALARVDTGAFARQVCDGAETAAQQLGFETILRLTYPPNTTDFTPIARQIAAAAPDLLVAVGRIRHDIALARALAMRNTRPTIGITAIVATPIAQFAQALGPDADGFIGPSQWEPPAAGALDVIAPDIGPPPDTALTLLQRAAARCAVPVDYPMAQAFAAGLIAQRCLSDAGAPDDAALRANAARVDFTTFYGRFRIDPTGRQIGRSVTLVQRRNGRKVIIWPPQLAVGQLRAG